MVSIDSLVHGQKSKIINIVRRSLGYIDMRLIDHGERVAYIADMIAQMDDKLNIDRKKLFILSLLHDIGAYKTEEIDNMVRFETDDVSNHAMYGYVFLHNLTPLGESAEAILYHHTNYADLEHIDSNYKTYAQLIFLADRIDILVLKPHTFDSLNKLTGTLFCPKLTELFFAAEKNFNISGHIKDLSYRDQVDAMVNTSSLSDTEVMSFLKMLVYSIDFRSPFTVTHTANTTSISTALARMFDLCVPDTRAVTLGAFLHDIGKIAIPYSILENPGKLTKEQMDIMKTHVEYSEQILRPIVSDEVCNIAVRHHEKLDASGYHHGLSGYELSLPERIVAVSDITSALINRRSYKEPFSNEKTISILKQMRDKGELCPNVCNMAIQRFDEILEITDQANDPIIKLYETMTRQYSELIAKSGQSARHNNPYPHSV